jgi:hypothetical protein
MTSIYFEPPTVRLFLFESNNVYENSETLKGMETFKISVDLNSLQRGISIKVISLIFKIQKDYSIFIQQL